jgi:hypothetical protein
MSRPHLRAAVAALLCGCIHANSYEGAEIPWEAVERIQIGETTRADVLAWLGAPQNFANPTALADFFESQGLESDAWVRYPAADVFVYQLTRGRLRGVVTLLYNHLDLKIDSDLVVILFDAEDRVRHVGIRHGRNGK